MTRTKAIIAPSDVVCTPARAEITSDLLTSSDLQSTTGNISNTVTPFDPKESSTGSSSNNNDSRSTDEKDDKETTEDAPPSTTTSSSKKESKRGLVSRRGRGLGNPGQRSSSRNASSDVPFEAPVLHRSSVTFSPSGDHEDAMEFSDDVSSNDENDNLILR